MLCKIYGLPWKSSTRAKTTKRKVFFNTFLSKLENRYGNKTVMKQTASPTPQSHIKAHTHKRALAGRAEVAPSRPPLCTFVSLVYDLFVKSSI